MTLTLDLDGIDFAKGGGLVTVVAQDAVSGDVLMVAFADREALERTLATGQMHYRSRTRGLWHKGATSGHVQHVVDLTPDCDHDTILARVRSAGPACHTGAPTCFAAQPATAMGRLDAVVAERAAAPDPAGYTGKLLADRNLRLKKLGEEAAEFAVACADADATRAVNEAADLVYHTVVALRALGRSWADVAEVLEARRR